MLLLLPALLYIYHLTAGSLFLTAAALLPLVIAWPSAFFLCRHILAWDHLETLTLGAAAMGAPFALEALGLLLDAYHRSAAQPFATVASRAARLCWVLRDFGAPTSLLFARYYFSTQTNPFLPYVARPLFPTSQKCHSFESAICAWCAAAAASPTLAARHFGVFVAIELAVELALALAFLPPILVIYHDVYEGKRTLPVWLCRSAPSRYLRRLLRYLSCYVCSTRRRRQRPPPPEEEPRLSLCALLLSALTPLEQTSTMRAAAARIAEEAAAGAEGAAAGASAPQGEVAKEHEEAMRKVGLGVGSPGKYKRGYIGEYKYVDEMATRCFCDSLTRPHFSHMSEPILSQIFTFQCFFSGRRFLWLSLVSLLWLSLPL